MAHSGGFEPPTARFVAEYSIQLSYECVIENPVLINRKIQLVVDLSSCEQQRNSRDLYYQRQACYCAVFCRDSVSLANSITNRLLWIHLLCNIL